MPDPISSENRRSTVGLVLAGGVGLGAYEAGAYAALRTEGGPEPTWLASSSIGTINAAIIAGNRPEQRVEKLRQFWSANSAVPVAFAAYGTSRPQAGVERLAYNISGVMETLFFGRPGIFRPRLAPGIRVGAPDVSALYDLAPLRASIRSFVDFDILNSGAVRLSVATTDVVTGERVVFDTARQRVGPDHLVASCALLPMFAPVEVEGRLLGDGCLSANTPLDLILDEANAEDLTCFVVDLFAREGSRPHSLTASVSRAGDLAFGNQTHSILEGRQREYRLRSLLAELKTMLPSEVKAEPAVASILENGRMSSARLFYLSFRAAPDETGPAKGFDFTRATIEDRWSEGGTDMRAALRTWEGVRHKPASGLIIHKIPASAREPSRGIASEFHDPAVRPRPSAAASRLEQRAS